MKNAQLNFQTLIILLVLFVTACNPIYYSPNTHNVPMLKAKGDVRIALHGNGDRLEASTAFAVDNNVGLTLDGGVFFPADDEQGDGGKGQFIQVGAGYFKPITDHVVFETYGLFGYGKVENHFPSTLDSFSQTTGVLNTNLARYGIQPSIGYTSRFFDIAFSTRLCGLSYFNTGGSLIFNNTDQVRYIEEQKAQFLIEPALTIRGGFDYLKLQLQLGSSINLTNKDFSQDNGHLTVGLLYSLNR